jgi:hypothetical protein
MNKTIIKLRMALPEPIKRVLRLIRLYFMTEAHSVHIEQFKLDNAKIYSDRENMIKALFKHKTIGAEVGVLEGQLSKFIVNQTKPKLLHLIDVDGSKISKKILDRDDVIFHEGLSTSFKTATELDWVYIDADHSYDGVCKDISHFHPMLKVSGIMVFNDYAKIATRTLGTLGVHKAVNEYIMTHDVEVLGLALQGNCLYDIAVRKKS